MKQLLQTSIRCKVRLLSDSITEGNLDLYADYMTLHFIGNNVDEVVDGLNQVLSEISLWCRNNKLTIHAGKSEAMIISHRPSVAH